MANKIKITEPLNSMIVKVLVAGTLRSLMLIRIAQNKQKYNRLYQVSLQYLTRVSGHFYFTNVDWDTESLLSAL